MDYSLSVECVSPFTLLRLALEFFPAGGQEPTLSTHHRDSPETWDVSTLSRLPLLPATPPWGNSAFMHFQALDSNCCLAWEPDGRHHRLHGHEFEQAPGVGDGQGGLVCCIPWGHKELDMTE